MSERLVNPRSVLVCTPSIDGKVEAGFCGGMVQAAAAGLIGNVSYLVGCSDIGAARCKMAHNFLKSEMEWLVFIDSDIQFSDQDLRLLLTVEEDPVIDGLVVPVGRTEAGEELAVTAEYSQKNEMRSPNRFGLGFARIHRSIFERLAALVTQDEGVEVMGRYYDGGEIMVDYFPMGVNNESRRQGEDTGFWQHVRYLGINPRIEQRTRLVHWGRYAYHYQIPVIGGM